MAAKDRGGGSRRISPSAVPNPVVRTMISGSVWEKRSLATMMPPNWKLLPLTYAGHAGPLKANTLLQRGRAGAARSTTRVTIKGTPAVEYAFGV